MNNNRRNFIRKISGSAAALAVGSNLQANEKIAAIELNSKMKVAPGDKIRIGLIGAGIIGHFDTDTALRVPGVEIVAACDLYLGRLDYAKEK